MRLRVSVLYFNNDFISHKDGYIYIYIVNLRIFLDIMVRNCGGLVGNVSFLIFKIFQNCITTRTSAKSI
jgi:hypothetical protein